MLLRLLLRRLGNLLLLLRGRRASLPFTLRLLLLLLLRLGLGLLLLLTRRLGLLRLWRLRSLLRRLGLFLPLLLLRLSAGLRGSLSRGLLTRRFLARRRLRSRLTRLLLTLLRVHGRPLRSRRRLLRFLLTGLRSGIRLLLGRCSLLRLIAIGLASVLPLLPLLVALRRRRVGRGEFRLPRRRGGFLRLLGTGLATLRVGRSLPGPVRLVFVSLLERRRSGALARPQRRSRLAVA